MKRGSIGILGAAATFAVLGIGVGTSGVLAQEEEADRRDPITIVTRISSGAYLGVRIEEVTTEAADRLGLTDVHGVRIDEVVEDGPADDAGLMADDILVSWNGTRLESTAQLQRQMRETPADRMVDFGVFRDGREIEISVKLGERSESPRFGVRASPRVRVIGPGDAVVAPGNVTIRGRSFGRGRMGVSIQSLGDQLASYFGVSGGALIISVGEDTPAERAGLEAGDVIIEIDGRAVEDPGELINAIGDLGAGPVEVRVVRNRNERSFTVELEERHGFFSCGDDEECEEFRDNWGRWADDFSDGWEVWAAENSDVWEEWAEQWEGRWQEWAEQWEGQWQNWAERLENDWSYDGVLYMPPLPLEGLQIELLQIPMPDIVIPEVIAPTAMPNIAAPRVL